MMDEVPYGGMVGNQFRKEVENGRRFEEEDKYYQRGDHGFQYRLNDYTSQRPSSDEESI